MKDKREELCGRMKRFSLEIIRLFSSLPKTTVAQVIGKQMLRSGTSLGAHYHEAVHSRSNAELVSKLDLGLQELRETRYWISLLVESKIVEDTKVTKLFNEIKELTNILITISKKIKAKNHHVQSTK